MPEMKCATNPEQALAAGAEGLSGPAARGVSGGLGPQAVSAQEAFARQGLAPPWSLAAPSCVLPADLGTNCAALAQYFPEIALALFETKACLAYPPEDLPGALAGLGARYHAHLPLDLPWADGVRTVAGIILALAKRAQPLAPRAWVLHPPEEPETLRALALELQQGGLGPENLLVENIQGRDLARMWPVVRELGLGACLDLGHMLAHGQEDFLDLPELWEHTRILHLNAPSAERPGRHEPLEALDRAGRALLARMLEGFKPGGTVVLELFSPGALFGSLGFLAGFCAGAPGGEARP